MSLFERDIVRRMIQQLGEIAARIAGLASERKFDQALSVVHETEQALLGPLTATLGAVDAKTIRLLVGSDDKLGVWAILLSERARLLDAQGEHDSAREVAKRALELFELLDGRSAVDADLLLAARARAVALGAKSPPRTG